MRKLIYILITITLFSCGTEPDVLTPIIGAEKAHFRSNNIGDKYERVLKNVQNDNPEPLDENIIACEFQVDGSDLVVRYEFDEEKLYSIQADIFFADTLTLGSFLRSIEEKYTAEHGPMTMDGGFLVWKDKVSGTEVEFTLADESIEFGQPKLSLTIYNFDY